MVAADDEHLSVAEHLAGIVFPLCRGVEDACGCVIFGDIEELAPVSVALVALQRALGNKDGYGAVHVLEGLFFDSGRNEGIDIHLRHLGTCSETIVRYALHGGGNGKFGEVGAVEERRFADFLHAFGEVDFLQVVAVVERPIADGFKVVACEDDAVQRAAFLESTLADAGYPCGDGDTSQVACVHQSKVANLNYVFGEEEGTVRQEIGAVVAIIVAIGRGFGCIVIGNIVVIIIVIILIRPIGDN